MNNSNQLKLFLTGATGYIGGGILKYFLKQNWHITALVRDAEKSKSLAVGGVRLVQGSLNDHDLLVKESSDHDLIIHSARDHGKEANDLDLKAVEAFLASAKLNAQKKRCTFIYTGGCLTVGEGPEEKDENCSLDKPHAYGAFRVGVEAKITKEHNPTGNLYTAIIRPTFVYGSDGGHVSQFLNWVLKEKKAAIINKGVTYLNFVHVADLARLYYLIWENNGSGIYHGTDNVYYNGNQLAEGLAKQGGFEVVEFEYADAMQKYGLFALGQIIDQKLVAKRSINELGWKLNYPSFLESYNNIVEELSNPELVKY